MEVFRVRPKKLTRRASREGTRDAWEVGKAGSTHYVCRVAVLGVKLYKAGKCMIAV